MSQNVRIYDVFDTLLTNNIIQLLKADDAALAEKAEMDYAAVRQEVDERMQWYRREGRLATILLPKVREGLERTLGAGYRIGVYSNGTPKEVRNMLKEGGIEELMSESDIVTVDDIGLKDQPSSYELLAARFRGLTVVSFADDGLRYCEAAVKSGAIQEVYYVNPNSNVATITPGLRWIANVADIDR